MCDNDLSCALEPSFYIFELDESLLCHQEKEKKQQQSANGNKWSSSKFRQAKTDKGRIYIHIRWSIKCVDLG